MSGKEIPAWLIDMYPKKWKMHVCCRDRKHLSFLSLDSARVPFCSETLLGSVSWLGIVALWSHDSCAFSCGRLAEYLEFELLSRNLGGVSRRCRLFPGFFPLQWENEWHGKAICSRSANLCAVGTMLALFWDLNLF